MGALAESRLNLERRLRTFQNMQKIIMPFVTHQALPPLPEDALLCLPSSLGRARTNARLPPSMLNLPKLQEVEADLRFAQAKEALDELRRHLLIKVHYYAFTRANVRGQIGNTRSQALLQQTAHKINGIADRYRRIRAAYHALQGDGPWELELRSLLAQDVRPLSNQHIAREPSLPSRGRGKGKEKSSVSEVGEGHKDVSWIWRTSLSGLDATVELHEGAFSCSEFLYYIILLHLIYLLALRIEWAWSLARKERWEEEVEHLKEEIRRTIESAHYSFQQWMKRLSSTPRLGSDPDLANGLRGYANRQAYIIAQQALRNAKIWNQPKSSTTWVPPVFVNPSQSAPVLIPGSNLVAEEVWDDGDEALGTGDTPADGYDSDS